MSAPYSDIAQLEALFAARRDTRHFTDAPVPDAVIEKALAAGHMAPSVGLTDATRYYLVRSGEVKAVIKELFTEYNKKAYQQIEDEAQKKSYAALKLEAITDAPLGLLVCYDRSVLNTFTIGTIASNDTIKFSAVCAVQNIWLSLTAQGYSMGWVSILNYHQFKALLGIPEHIEPLGYFCIGKPATDYDQQPMLQQQGWKQKAAAPAVSEINTLSNTGSLSLEPAQKAKHENSSLTQQLQHLIDHKTKPTGSLGALEGLALQIGKVFKTTTPEIKNPHMLIFAADHGIAQHGVSAYPQEVTSQMIKNFLEGGAAINVFCRQHALELLIIDAGINYDFAPNLPLINHKIGRGTQSFLHGPAMSPEQLQACLQKGAEVVDTIYKTGCNTLGFGEMGIGNTSTAAVLMSLLCTIPLEKCIGKGTGVAPEKLTQKQQLLQQAVARYPGAQDPLAIMAYFGGFEIMQMAGGMLQASKRGMLLLVDGFISTVAFLCAYTLDPAVRAQAVFCHQSDEKGHKLLLQHLEAQPLLQLGMRLGEGTGCALAFPLLQSATAFLKEMASFESAGVSNNA